VDNNLSYWCEFYTNNLESCLVWDKKNQKIKLTKGNKMTIQTKIIGIINLTDNSMSGDGIANNTELAIQRINEFLEAGADFLDIGAEATSYGATLLTADEEWARLEPVLTKATDHKNKIMIDTYHAKTVERALALGFYMFNDVSGGKYPEYIKLIAANPHTKYVMMHSTSLPADKSTRITNLQQMYEWFERKIPEVLAAGVAKEQLIIDPGLGFTMHPTQSFELLTNLQKLKSFGYPVYIGHSRKTAFDSLTNIPPAERDLETVVTSLYLHNKVDFLRVHNIPMHTRALNVWNELNKTKVAI